MAVQQEEPVVLPPELSGLTFEKVWASIQETRQILQQSRQETEQVLRQSREETDRKIQETGSQIKETDRILRKMMGDLGRKFGTVIEHLFIPNLLEKFNALGFVFEKSSPNVLIGSEEHQIYAEIDVLLENGDAALAVEVKTQANIADVRDHVERMGKLRRYFDLHRDGRKLYGALAAAIIPGNVRDFAFKQGFYLIRQSGDNVNILAPPGKLRVW
jgi:hypothetical protein